MPRVTETICENSPSEAPEGLRKRWFVFHALVLILVAVIGDAATSLILPPSMKHAPPLIAIITVAALPWLPRYGKFYRTFIDFLLRSFAYFILITYEAVYHVRRKRRRYLRLTLLSTIPALGLLTILAFRLYSFHATIKSNERRFDQAWATMCAVICDRPIQSTSHAQLDEWYAIARTLPSSSGDIPFLTAIQQVFKGLVSPPTETVAFSDRCARAASQLDKSPAPSPLLSLLTARLYLKASQNGINMNDVEHAEAALGECDTLLPPVPSDKGTAQQLASFHNYRGVVAKLKSQWHTVSGESRASALSECAELLAAAYEDYCASVNLANKYSLAEAQTRAANNLVDWHLLLYDLMLANIDAFPKSILPPDVRSKVRYVLTPADLIPLLEEQYSAIVHTFHARATPGVLFTMVQTQCLIAEARFAANPDDPSISALLARAITQLELVIDLYILDEPEVLRHPTRFHLGVLLTLDSDVASRFRALQSKVVHHNTNTK